MIPAPDGYQYGVRFADGSIAGRWNGRSQRKRAEEYRDQVLADQLAWCGRTDPIVVVRRLPDSDWEEVT